MDIHVSVGEWMQTLRSLMSSAADGDCFCLPTPMHLHAFLVLKEDLFSHRDFKVTVKQDVSHDQ
jgi:hypothetical protein